MHSFSCLDKSPKISVHSQPILKFLFILSQSIPSYLFWEPQEIRQELSHLPPAKSTYLLVGQPHCHCPIDVSVPTFIQGPLLLGMRILCLLPSWGLCFCNHFLLFFIEIFSSLIELQLAYEYALTLPIPRKKKKCLMHTSLEWKPHFSDYFHSVIVNLQWYLSFAHHAFPPRSPPSQISVKHSHIRDFTWTLSSLQDSCYPLLFIARANGCIS